MSPADVVATLRQYNAWRRGSEGDQPSPTIIGLAIDEAIAAVEQRDQLLLAEEGAKEAYGGIVEQKRDLEEEVKRLRETIRLQQAIIEGRRA